MSTDQLDCLKARPHLALFAGRDLEEPLCSQVESHVAECAVCRAELDLEVQARERIASLGVHTSQASAGVDLWPAIERRLQRERAQSAAPARSFARRALVPLTLVAAASLLVLLRWGGAPSADPAPIGAPVASQAPSITSAGTGDVAAVPSVATPVASPGGLRRAGPDDERLRDSSVPLQLPLRTLLNRGAPGAPNALAGDSDVR